MRMLAVVLSSLGTSFVGDRMEQFVLKEPERTRVRLAQSPARRDDLVENCL